MTKTGKSLSSALLFLLFLSITHLASAQDVTVEATLSETNIFEGESVQFQLSISGTAINSLDRPQMPSVNGLRYLPNRTSTASNYTYTGGQPQVTQTFGYTFIAQSNGQYTFPAISVSVNGKTYQTKLISFKVLDPKTIDNGQAARSPDIYLRLEPSVTNPVVGQQVIADIILYFKDGVDVSSYNAIPGWKAEGFWKEELDNPSQARSTSTIIGGVRYKRARLLQYALFPTKAGELTLSPFTITVRVRQNNRGIRDPFNFGIGQETKELKTLPVTVNVERLPEPSNAEFIGAVGDFNIERSINPTNAFVGESVEIVTRISGSGNVPLLNKPEYEFPEALEEYNPQETSNLSRSNRLIAGSKTFTDIVIARGEGVFTIPEKRIASYNPEAKRFEYTTLPALTLNAVNDPNATVASLEDMRLDVSPVIGLVSWHPIKNNPLSSNTLVWGLLFIPLLIVGGAYGAKKYTDRLQTDTGFARSQKAKTQALSTLDEAEKADDIKTGYHLIQKALSIFIADKLNLPEAGLSSKRLIDEAVAKNTEVPAKSLRQLFDKCETIAFAPNVSPEGLKTDIEKARSLVKELGKLL